TETVCASARADARDPTRNFIEQLERARHPYIGEESRTEEHHATCAAFLPDAHVQGPKGYVVYQESKHRSGREPQTTNPLDSKGRSKVHDPRGAHATMPRTMRRGQS